MGKYKVHFQKALNFLLASNTVSQEKLAYILRTTQQTISRWCNGISYPDFDKLCELCFIFNVTPNFFFLFE